MISELNEFYLNQPEPNQSTFLALRDYFLSFDRNIEQKWRYKLPFFYYKNKMFCYLWKDKKTQEPYIGVVKGNEIEHPLLEKGDRKRMKILRVNPEKDLPIEVLNEIFSKVKEFY